MPGRVRGRQTDSEGRGRETPRAQGRAKSWGNSLCFWRVRLHIPLGLGRNIQLSSFFSTRLSRTVSGSGVWGEVSEACGWCHRCLPEATAGFNIWSLTSNLALTVREIKDRGLYFNDLSMWPTENSGCVQMCKFYGGKKVAAADACLKRDVPTLN